MASLEPKSLKIGYHTVPVVWHNECVCPQNDHQTVYEDNDGDNGLLIIKGGYRIHVARNSAASKQETLLHEAMHIIVRNTGLHRCILGMRHDEENVVTAMAAGTLELLRRNRGLGEFLATPTNPGT